MARLTPDQWQEARKKWEADERPGFAWIAKELDITRQAISRKASDDGWVKEAKSSTSGNVAPDVALNVASRVAQHSNVAVNVAQQDQGGAPPAQKTRAKTAPRPAQTMISHDAKTIEWVDAKGEEDESCRRPVGRPSLYRDEYAKMLIAFFNIEIGRVEKKVKITKGGDAIEVDEFVLNAFPTLTRFAAEIGVSAKTLWEWANEKDPDGTPRRPEFCNAYACARDLQTSLLIEGGMNGYYEPRFAALAAKNLIGWRDSPAEEAAPVGGAIDQAKLDDIYKLGMQKIGLGRMAVLARKVKPEDVSDG